MSRPPRIEFPGAVHHVMARGDRREEIFRDDRDRLKFLGYLAEGAERYRVKVHCYVFIGSLESKRRPAKELRTKKEMVGAGWSSGDPGAG